ncbi:MAG: aldehyde dehydrogenase family protein [Solirubrobacteraceae bacterium MAG38_C4-C5]|nr:aldehyde dehydrogenase family protein [Candidatus Siliceabacter maunaloa]
MAAAPSAERLEARSPVDGSLLGTVVATPPGAVPAAIATAAEVQPLWAALRLRDRARYLRRAAQAIIDELDELSALLVHEQGRPCAEALTQELLPSIDTLQWLAEEGPRVLGPQRIGLSRTVFPTKRARLTFEPLGVTAVLTPGAEPWHAPLGDVAVALLGGNGVVLTPSSQAGLAAERIARVFARAGLPEGLLQIVHGGADTARALIEGAVAQVVFTGSAEAGRAVGEICARRYKRTTLEAGGHDALLVLRGANVDRAIRGAAWAAFANAGQSPGSVKRAFVGPEAAQRFIEGVIEAARALRVGDPAQATTDVGPLLTVERSDALRELVDEAVEAGATLACGGPLERGAGAWWAPTVLTDVPPDARLWREAAPGPVLAVAPVAGEREAIARANEGEAGLGASVWIDDLHQGRRIAHELRAGMVWLNDHLPSRTAPSLPWGGVGASGVGRARGAQALHAAVEPKLVTWDPTGARPVRWHPYDQALVEAGRAMARLRSARDRDRERGLRSGAAPLARVAVRTLRAARRR